jgi:hypothetical protein
MVSNRFYLRVPLDVYGWEDIEALEHLALYDEFAERIDDAVELIREGQQHWVGHQDDGGEWSFDAVRVLAEVRRLSPGIRQRFDQSQEDLPRSIRWTVGESSESAVTDCQYVAALAIDRACRAVEVLGRWLRDFDADLYTGGRDEMCALVESDPDSFYVLMSEVRREQSHLEIEARESAADLIGAARHYMTLARVYASPLLSNSEKIRISATARKAGNNSGVVRREATADRNQSICSHAKRLLGDGRSEREIVGVIVGTDSALKTPGGAAKLSKKQIRNILVAGGVL